jgi:hypothetical protein
VPPCRLTRSKGMRRQQPPREFVDRAGKRINPTGVADQPFGDRLDRVMGGPLCDRGSITSVMMMLRPSTISEDDAASLKRALLRNLRSWDLQLASWPARSRVPGDLDVEFPRVSGPKYLIRLLDIANKAATSDAAGRPDSLRLCKRSAADKLRPSSATQAPRVGYKRRHESGDVSHDRLEVTRAFRLSR